MKKSELKEYIREAILAELTPQDITANTTAKVAIDDTVKDLTLKVTQTTDIENKKAAVAALNAAKTRQAQINKAIQSKQAIPADLLPEGEDDEDEDTSEKEPSKAELKKVEKDLGKSSKHAKKLTAAELERYNRLKTGITAKVNRLKKMSKEERAKSDDLKSLKDIINRKDVKDLFNSQGKEILKSLISGIID
jgi:hypothetical protein